MNTVVYGTGSYASIVARLAIQSGVKVKGYIDDFWQESPEVFTFNQAVNLFPPSEFNVAIAIGYRDLKARLRVVNKLKAYNYSLFSFIHPSAFVDSTAEIGEGTIVMANSVVDVGVTIGIAAVLWPGTCINHDSVVGDNVFLSPSVTLCGFSKVGHSTFIGAGSVIVDHADIPAESFIKMGSRYVQK